jgi:hypothetical protein
MSGQGRRAAGVAGGALVLLTGCTFGGHSGVSATSPPAESAPPPVGSIEHPRPVECADGLTFTGGGTTPPSPTTATTAPAPPSSDRPVRATGSARPTGTGTHTAPGKSTPSPTGTGMPTGAPPAGRVAAPAADVTVGPLTWKGLRDMATGDQTVYGTHNSDGWHYRIGPVLLPGSTVTLTIGAQQRARAGLEYGGGYGTTPTPAVTFHSCPGAATTFPGGFFITGDGRACVPVDIRIGDGRARRVLISFFDGDCRA